MPSFVTLAWCRLDLKSTSHFNHYDHTFHLVLASLDSREPRPSLLIWLQSFDFFKENIHCAPIFFTYSHILHLNCKDTILYFSMTLKCGSDMIRKICFFFVLSIRSWNYWKTGNPQLMEKLAYLLGHFRYSNMLVLEMIYIL